MIQIAIIPVDTCIQSFIFSVVQVNESHFLTCLNEVAKTNKFITLYWLDLNREERACPGCSARYTRVLSNYRFV